MSSFALIVFDLDGTLIDSRRDIADAANALLAASGAPPLPDADIGRMVGDGVAQLVQRAFMAVGRQAPPGAVEQFLELYDARLVHHTRAYAGIPEALAELVRRARLAVLTNKPLGAARRVLAALDLTRYFADEAVLGGDGPLARKPDGAGLRALADRAGVRLDDTVLVGDSIIDWRTASGAGVAICLARYGFGFESFPRDVLRGDERFADRPDQLPGLL